MSSNNQNNNRREISWLAVVIGFVIAAPIGIILLVLKIIQESKPQPQRWGQTGPIPTARQQQQRQTARSSSHEGKQKYPNTKLKDGKVPFWLGLVHSVFWAFCGSVAFWDWGFDYLSYAIEDSMPCFFIALIGVGAMIWGQFKTKRSRKFKRYLARIGDEPLVPLRPLAESLSADMDEVCETLQQMIDQGIFGERAYLDLSTETLVLDSSVARPAPKAKPVEKKEAKLSSDEEILFQIRRANDLIPDEEISRKIDRIEEITRHILNYLKKHPERSSELHTFLDYYLPTTLKMLNTYAELDTQQIGTENVNATKKRIEGVLDKVVEGFETQLDKLFEGDMLDISSDIDVMEKMLQRDGLSGEMKMPKADSAAASNTSSGYTPHLTLDPQQSDSSAAQQMH